MFPMQIPSSSSYSSGHVTCRKFSTPRLMCQSACKCCIPGPLDYVSAGKFPWDVACWDETNACVVSFVVLWECIKFGRAAVTFMVWQKLRNLNRICCFSIQSSSDEVIVKNQEQNFTCTKLNITSFDQLSMHKLYAGNMSLSLRMSWWFVLARRDSGCIRIWLCQDKASLLRHSLEFLLCVGDEADWQIAQGWVKECALGYVISSQSSSTLAGFTQPRFTL